MQTVISFFLFNSHKLLSFDKPFDPFCKFTRGHLSPLQKAKEKGKQIRSSLHMMFFFGQVDLTKMSHPVKILALVLEKRI